MERFNESLLMSWTPRGCPRQEAGSLDAMPPLLLRLSSKEERKIREEREATTGMGGRGACKNGPACLQGQGV